MAKKIVKFGIRTVHTVLRENSNIKGKTHIFKVRIIDEFGDQYQISYLEQLQGEGYVGNKSFIVPKTEITGIIEKETTWFQRAFGLY